MNWSVTKARWLLVLSLVVLGFFGWQNLQVKNAGIIQDALLDPHNPYVLWQQQAEQDPELNTGETLSFVLSFPEGLQQQDLVQLVRMTEQVRQLFPQGVVWSLAANSYQYQANGGEVKSEPYLPEQWLDQKGLPRFELDLELLKQRVQQDPNLYGPLIGKTFDYAQILVFLPKNYSEQGVADTVAEYLEQRSVSELEWLLWKGDIQPAAEFANVSLGGWSVARGLMHYALISDVLFYSTIGLLVATLAAFFSLGSWRQAVFCSLAIFCSFVLVRGSISLLDDLGLRLFGLPLYERVYFLLVLSAMIVAGISFNVRAFEAFNDAWQHQQDQPHTRLWQSLAPLKTKFNLVALIAIVNFATLPQIGIRGIMEVGVLSALGILYQRILVVTLVPALQLCFGGLPSDLQQSVMASWQQGYSKAVNWLPEQSYLAIVAMNARASALVALSITAVVLGSALAVVGYNSSSEQPLIRVLEKPIDYLPDTIVDRGRQILNQPGHYGFGQLPYLVVPKNPLTAEGFSAVENPLFIHRVYQLQQAIAGLSDSRYATSVLDKLSELSQQTPEIAATLPATAQQAHDLLQLISWDMQDPGLKNYLWSSQGYVLFLSHPADDSKQLRGFAEQVMRLAEAEFPDLQLLPFGRLHSYHQTDLYISQGKPLNVLLSFPLVVGLCFLWLWRQQQKLRHCSHYSISPLKTSLAISIPFVFAYAVVVLVMAALDIPLDQATACATALGINAAIDFDLYLVDDFRLALDSGKTPDQALQYCLFQRGRLTVLDAKLNAICFSFLMLSPFLPIQRLGFIMLVMLVTCAFGALFLMAAVLRSCVVLPVSQTAVAAEHKIRG